MRKLELRTGLRRESAAPEIPASRPRAVKFTAAGRTLAVIATLLIAGSIVAGMWIHMAALNQRRLRDLLDAEGATAIGQVVKLSRTRGDNPRYRVWYVYEASGHRYQGMASIRRVDWAKLSIGSQVAVRYLAAEPGRSWLADYPPKGAPLWLAPLAALGLALLGLLCWSALYRQRRLLSEGRPADAVVIESKVRKRGHGGGTGVVRYEFRTLSGSLVRGKCNTSRTPPPEGSTVKVLYDPDEPRRSALYPLSLVRPA